VNGLAPLVIDILGMQPNMNEIYQTYGRWPIALKDYTNQNLTRFLFFLKKEKRKKKTNFI